MTYNEYVHILSNSEEFKGKEFVIDIELSEAELICPFSDEVEMLKLHPFFGHAFHGSIMFSDAESNNNDNRLYTDSFGVYCDIKTVYGEKNINARLRVLAEYVYECEETLYLDYGIIMETENYGFKIKKLICDLDNPETDFVYTRVEEAIKYVDEMFDFPKMLPPDIKGEERDIYSDDKANFSINNKRFTHFKEVTCNESNTETFKVDIKEKTIKNRTREEMIIDLFLAVRKMKK